MKVNIMDKFFKNVVDQIMERYFEEIRVIMFDESVEY